MFEKKFIQEVSDLIFESLSTDSEVLLEIDYKDWKSELNGKEKYWKNIARANTAKSVLTAPFGPWRRKYWERAEAARDNASQLDAEYHLGKFERKRSDRDLHLGRVELNDAKSKIAAGALVASAVFAAYKFVRNYSSKAKEACKNLSGVQRDVCILKYKIDSLQKQNAILAQQKSKCGASTDPVTCSNKLEEKIKNNVGEIEELKLKLVSIQSGAEH